MLLNSREYLNLSVIGIHKKDDFSINDGIFLDFSNKFNYVNPMHIKFSFYTPSPATNQFSNEVCNLRFTNISLELLSGNDLKTNSSDPVFFRIRNNKTISINDKTVNLDINKTNYDRWNDIDIILEWDQRKVSILYNNNPLDYESKFIDLSTFFYHDKLKRDETKPSKIILYNFSSNTSCIIRNLTLCEQFCDDTTKNNYLYYSSSFFQCLNVFLFLTIGSIFLI